MQTIKRVSRPTRRAQMKTLRLKIYGQINGLKVEKSPQDSATGGKRKSFPTLFCSAVCFPTSGDINGIISDSNSPKTFLMGQQANACSNKYKRITSAGDGVQ